MTRARALALVRILEAWARLLAAMPPEGRAKVRRHGDALWRELLRAARHRRS
jgi:hypothetical protein